MDYLVSWSNGLRAESVSDRTSSDTHLRRLPRQAFPLCLLTTIAMILLAVVCMYEVLPEGSNGDEERHVFAEENGLAWSSSALLFRVVA